MRARRKDSAECPGARGGSLLLDGLGFTESGCRGRKRSSVREAPEAYRRTQHTSRPSGLVEDSSGLSPLRKSIRTKGMIQAHETTRGSQRQKTQSRPTCGFSLFEFTTFFFPRFEGYSTTSIFVFTGFLLQLLPLSLSPPFS